MKLLDFNDCNVLSHQLPPRNFVDLQSLERNNFERIFTFGVKYIVDGTKGCGNISNNYLLNLFVLKNRIMG